MKDIGKLSPVDIRQVWADEARDSTPWLAENANLLGEALGMDLLHEETEAAVVRYSADLVLREEFMDRRVSVGGSGVREGGSGIEAGPARTCKG